MVIFVITVCLRSSKSIEAILNCLHPTPAVCGLPQKSALKLIDELEQHKREFYAGYIGEINYEQTAIYVNLRCCQITENQIHLFLTMSSLNMKFGRSSHSM